MNGLLERLATPLSPDAFRSLLGPLHTRTLQGIIRSVTPLTATSAEVTIQPGRAWSGHTPGQYVTLGVEIDGVRHSRCYSLTSTPTSRGLISIAVQAKPDGFVSQHLVFDARAGDVVQLSEPAGDFTLTAASPGPVLLLTGGSGLTPVMGMLRSLEVTGSNHDVVLLHHAPTRAASMFVAELESMAEHLGWLTVEHSFTHEGGAHLGATRLDDVCPDWADRATFACGPEALLDFAIDRWSEAGRTDALHLERFVAPKRATSSSVGGAASSGGTALFAKSDVEAPASPDTPLLEVAEAAGLVPEAGCRMGICHTCTTRLEDGCVTDVRDGRRSEAGTHVQICVSVADGNVTLDI